MPSRYYYNLAQFYIGKDKYSEAATQIRTAISCAPKNPLYYRELAYILMVQDKFSEALKAANYAIHLDPKNSHGYCIKGKILGKKGNFVASCNIFEKLKTDGKCKTCSRRYLYLGLTHEQRKDFKEAIQHFKHAHVLDPKDLGPVELLSECYQKIGDYKSALKYINNAIKLDSKDSSLLFRKAVILMALKIFIEAKQVYLKYLKVNPRDDRALTNLGSVLCRLGKHKEEIDLYRKALGINKSNYIAAQNLATEYFKIGKYTDALRFLKLSVYANPGNISSRVLQVMSFARLGKYNEMRKVVKRIDVSKIQDWDEFYDLACAYSLAGNGKRALQLLMKAVRLHPDVRDLMRTDKDLDAIRGAVAFEKILELRKVRVAEIGDMGR